MSVCPIGLAVVLVACGGPPAQQDSGLKTATAVLEQYQHALGGISAIAAVQSEVVHGEIETSGKAGKSKFIYYAKPGKYLLKVFRPDGTEVVTGFDGNMAWTQTEHEANVEKDVIVDSMRRDADLQYPLHETDYFRNLDLAGVTDFDGRRCYWLHGTTRWGKDNNQFYDVKTGLLVGYRFQSDTADGGVATEVFEDYKSFGGPMVPTKRTSRSGDQWETFTLDSVSYEPVSDLLFKPPQAVKTQLRKTRG